MVITFSNDWNIGKSVLSWFSLDSCFSFYFVIDLSTLLSYFLECKSFGKRLVFLGWSRRILSINISLARECIFSCMHTLELFQDGNCTILNVLAKFFLQYFLSHFFRSFSCCCDENVSKENEVLECITLLWWCVKSWYEK